MITSTIGAILKFIFNMTGSYGISIIILTVIIKLILFPFSISQIRSTRKMKELQPQIEELKKRYKDDKEQLNIKTMELYRENKYNPFSGCLPLLIQLPIIFSLFRVFRAAEEYIPADAAKQAFLWVKDLSQPDLIANILPNVAEFIGTLPGLLPILASITTYLQFTQSQNDQVQNSTTNMMGIMMPIMILMFGKSFAAGLMIYWTVSNLFQIVQTRAVPKFAREEK